jgi:hypothetical protein
MLIPFQSSNMSIALPKKMIHPIASLVNPHATLAAAEAKLIGQSQPRTAYVGDISLHGIWKFCT